MNDNHVFDVPKCKVTYIEKLHVSALYVLGNLYTGPRYRVELVDGNTTYWAGEYPVAEFAAAISTAHRIAKRAQTTRYNNVATLLTAMETTKE